MFEFVRRHTRLLQFVLVLLIFPSFVFFGVQGYEGFRDSTNVVVAEVGGREITRAEWDAAHRNQVQRMRQQLPDVDAAMFDTPAFRQSTLDSLVRQNVMLAAVERQHLVTSDARLQRLFRADPQFSFLRNPDGSVNAALLQAQGMSSEQFAERLRQDYSVGQVMAAINDSAVAPATPATAALDAYFQQRSVQVQRFRTQDYLKSVKADDAEIEAWYKDPAHAAQFRAPEQADIEYVALDLDAVAKGVNPSEEELRKFYDENAARYTTPAERQASHILIKAEKDSASEADRAAAKAKAEGLLAQAKAANAEQFAALAKKESQDPGSAAKGGDLGWFGRDAMVKPFEDVAFSLAPGQTSDVVESDFGFHVIRVTGARGGEKKSFEAARAEIEAEARKQLAQARFAESAEQLTNLVFEQADSLKPAADALGLTVLQATVQRQPEPGATGALASKRLFDALFDEQSLSGKRNTEATEVGPNQLAAARVVAYRPAHVRTLDEVRDEVRQAVLAAKAAETARKAGEARLALGRKEPAAGLGTPTLRVSRAQPGELPPQALEAVLLADTAKLPSWLGVLVDGEGYVVAQVLKVDGRDPVVAADADAIRRQYAQAWTQAETQAYYTALKDKYKARLTEAAATVANAASE